MKGDKSSNSKLSFQGPLEVWTSSENNNYSQGVFKLPNFFVLLKGTYFTLFLLFSSSVVSHSAMPCTAARHASLSFTISRSLLKLMSIESVLPSNHLIPCCPLLPLPSVFPSSRIFSNELALFLMSWLFSNEVAKELDLQFRTSVLPRNIQD